MNRHVSEPIVPYSALYGERDMVADPEFLHIEDIRTRSRLYDWQIAPHSHHGMFQILFVAKGDPEIRLEDRREQVSGPCAVTIPSGAVHAFAFSPETVGSVVTVAETLLTDARYQRSRALFDPLFEAPMIINFEDAPGEAQRIGRILELMAQEFQWPEIGRSSMFEWLLRILLMIIRRRIDARAPRAEAKGFAGDAYGRFRVLVEENFKHHWSIERYAHELGLSQARLNRLCRSTRGRTALGLVQDRLVLEAQRLLVYTSATAAMVAYELGFQDPAYFSRFFKRQTGLAPGQYRKQRG